MSKLEHILIVPYSQSLISTYSGFDIAARTCKEEEIKEIYKEVSKKNKLYCVILETDKPLTDISFNWGDIPVALFISGIGPVSNLTKKLSEISSANVRFYLNDQGEVIYRDTRILSTLGISSAVVIGDKPNFESLKDLMIYSYYNTLEHGEIEPFSYIAKNYNGEFIDYKTVYFNNPLKFLHVDEYGRVAFSKKELIEGKFLPNDEDWPERLKSLPEYKEKLCKQHELFLRSDGCAYCEGYTVCGGAFEHVAKEDGCKGFFRELLDGIEFVQQKKKPVKKVWQV